MVQRGDEALSGKGLLLRRQQPHIQGPDELGLPVGIQRVAILRNEFLIGAFRALAVFPDARQLRRFRLAEDRGDLQHTLERKICIGRGFLRVRNEKVDPVEGHDVIRLGPLAVGLAAVNSILSIFVGKMHGLGEDPAPFPRAADHKVRIAQHVVVIRTQQAVVAVFLIEIVRDIDTCARPADGAVHFVDARRLVCKRRDLRQAAAAPLAVKNVAHMLAGKGRIVREIGRRVEEDLTVARPAHALTRRAVRRHVGGVALQGPQSVVVKLVDQAIGALEF